MNYSVIPSIRAADLKAAIAFYTEVLEFAPVRDIVDDANVSLRRGDGHIMLEAPTDFYGEAYNAAIRERLAGRSASSLYIEATDLEEFHARLVERGAMIIDPIAPRKWGQTEFTVETPEGTWLTFWKALE